MPSAEFRALGLVRSVVKADLRALDPGPGASVLVGCSGGADSLALAAALALEAREVARSTRRRGYRICVGAVVVDHGLQPGSTEAAARAAQQCRDLGMDPVLLEELSAALGSRTRENTTDTGGLGPEGDARAARYQVFKRMLDDTGAAALYLGHTLDDQAETVLLALARGSGARSLAAMPAVRGPYRRPLLALRRADTEAACRCLGLTAWQDPTNAQTGPGAPLRSRVRHEVLPVLTEVLGPGLAVALARSADQLRDDADALDQLAEAHYQAATAADPATRRTRSPHPPSPAPQPSLGLAHPTEPVTLAAAPLAAQPPGIRRRVLRRAALDAGVPGGGLTSRHLAALDTLVANWRGQGPISLPSGVIARRAYGRLYLWPRDSDAAQDGAAPQAVPPV